MGDVTIRDLRNKGGEVVDRVQRGERLTITRSGRPVAALVPVAPDGLHRSTLIERRRSLPDVDPAALRRDVDAVIDAEL
jgi:prevent-host-death family protein